MTPALASPGALPNDPKLGTPEYVRMVALHDEAVARVAKLRRMESKLPQAIADAELRVRDLAGRLGLASSRPKPRGRRISDPARLVMTNTQWETLAALPGTRAEVAERLGIGDHAASTRLALLRRGGLVVKDPGYRGVWRRVESAEEAA